MPDSEKKKKSETNQPTNQQSNSGRTGKPVFVADSKNCIAPRYYYVRNESDKFVELALVFGGRFGLPDHLLGFAREQAVADDHQNRKRREDGAREQDGKGDAAAGHHLHRVAAALRGPVAGPADALEFGVGVVVVVAAREVLLGAAGLDLGAGLFHVARGAGDEIVNFGGPDAAPQVGGGVEFDKAGDHLHRAQLQVRQRRRPARVVSRVHGLAGQLRRLAGHLAGNAQVRQQRRKITIRRRLGTGIGSAEGGVVVVVVAF